MRAYILALERMQSFPCVYLLCTYSNFCPAPKNKQTEQICNNVSISNPLPKWHRTFCFHSVTCFHQTKKTKRLFIEFFLLVFFQLFARFKGKTGLNRSSQAWATGERGKLHPRLRSLSTSAKTLISKPQSSLSRAKESHHREKVGLPKVVALINRLNG